MPGTVSGSATIGEIGRSDGQRSEGRCIRIGFGAELGQAACREYSLISRCTRVRRTTSPPMATGMTLGHAAVADPGCDEVGASCSARRSDVPLAQGAGSVTSTWSRRHRSWLIRKKT